MRALVEAAGAAGVDLVVLSDGHKDDFHGELVERGPAIHRESSGEWLMLWCWQRGIAPEQVLVVGDALDGLPEAVVRIGGGRVEFAAALEDQIARRRRGELAVLVEDPEWTLTVTASILCSSAFMSRS